LQAETPPAVGTGGGTAAIGDSAGTEAAAPSVDTSKKAEPDEA
jgi:hypothetical protein